MNEMVSIVFDSIEGCKNLLEEQIDFHIIKIIDEHLTVMMRNQRRHTSFHSQSLWGEHKTCVVFVGRVRFDDNGSVNERPCV